MATDRPQAEDSGSDNGPPPARTHTVRRWCQRAAAAAGPAGAAVDEGRGGSAHRAHQGRRQDHLRPLQLLHFRHVGGLGRGLQLHLRPWLRAALPRRNQRSGSTAASTTKVVTAAASGVSWWLRDLTAWLIYVLPTNPASFGLAGHYFEFIYVLVTP
nr:uncharacterized protein LOC109739094 isoform X1 [Aegilops tauschii subsp. strangulata]